MSTLVVDTESTGFPIYKKAVEDIHQPFLIELGAELVDGNEVKCGINVLVNPGSEVEVPEVVTRLTGISRDSLDLYGISMKHALLMLHILSRKATRIVAHNIEFDSMILAVAYHRAGLTEFYNELLEKNWVCTMKSSTDLVRIPSKRKVGSWKWPSLEEAYKALVDPEGFVGSHRARSDVIACRKILHALEAQGAVLVA